MVYDLLEYLKDEKTAENLAMDNHKLKNGYYFVINNNEIEEIEIQKNNIVTTDIKTNDNWLKKVDYYSQIVSMNKPLDSKKTFHNNNYMCIFIKTSKLKEISITNEDLLNSYDSYIERAKKKLFTKEFLYFAEKLQLLEIDIEHMEKSFNIIKNNLINIKDIVSKKDNDDLYTKIYLYDEIEKYLLEYKRYTYSSIFNTNDYNIEFNDTVLGVPDSNMTLNNKMPYLKHRSTSYVAPFLVNIDNAIKEKQMLNFLDGQKGTREDKDGKNVEFNLTSGYIDLKEIELNNLKHEFEKANQEMHYLKFERGKSGVVITEYDFVPNYEDENKFNFTYKNYFYYEPEKYSLTTEGTDCSTKQNVFKYINKSLYQSQLIQYLNTNAGDISESKYLSSNLRKNIILNRDAYRNYFYKSDDRSLKNVLDKSTLDAVLDLIYYRDDINFMKVKGALNTRFNLLNYFKIKGSYNMGSFLQKEYSSLNEKLDSNLPECKTDEEFYFLSGQYVKYLIIQSQAQKKDHSMLEGCLRAKTNKRFKEEVNKLYFKYKHELSMKFNRLNNLQSMFNSYNAKTEINLDYFLAGVTSSNVLFEKSEKNTESEDK